MNAQLDRIEIRGFKSIKECNLKLNSINVLIGSNGAGKSNFISVFSLMTDVLKKSLQLEANKCDINKMMTDVNIVGIGFIDKLKWQNRTRHRVFVR